MCLDELKQMRWSMIFVGVGLMAAIDEIIFHQLLSWHHFYDGSSTDIALLTDGLLHAAELVAIVAGFFLYADTREKGVSAPSYAWAWFLISAGGFQLFDGIVDHKVLRLHQVRYGVDTLAYDIAWNAAGLALILIGFLLLRRARTDAGGHSSSPRLP